MACFVYDQKYMLSFLLLLINVQNLHIAICVSCEFFILFCRALIFTFFISACNFVTSQYCTLCYDRKKDKLLTRTLKILTNNEFFCMNCEEKGLLLLQISIVLFTITKRITRSLNMVVKNCDNQRCKIS